MSALLADGGSSHGGSDPRKPVSMAHGDPPLTDGGSSLADEGPSLADGGPGVNGGPVLVNGARGRPNV